MPAVESVHAAAEHGFSKPAVDEIRLREGLGVEGDAHEGETVQHLSRVRRDPSAPNLRQVHLIHAELLDELRAEGFDLSAGDLGENVSTRGVDLLALPVGTELRLGASAVVRVTGLRNPCVQIDRFRPGMLKQVLVKHHDGTLERRTGVMGVVVAGGVVRGGDPVVVVLPQGEHRPLEKV